MRRLAITIALLAAAAAAAAAQADGGFLAAPTDQLTVPGHVAGAQVTPEGYVYTGAAEFSHGFGPRLRAWDVRTRERAAGRYPVFTSAATAGRVRYVLTTFADEVDGAPVVFVHVDAVNAGRRPAVARWRTVTQWSGGRRQDSGRYTFRYERPSEPTVPGLYVQPGETFDRDAVHRFGDGALTRDGRVLYAWLRAPAARSGEGRARRPSSRVGRVEFRRRLAPGQTTAFDLRIPVTPRAMTGDALATLRATPFGEHRLAVIRRWRLALAGAAVVELPEPAVEDAFRASVVQLLEPRYVLDGSWVQPVNKLQYHSFWIRDTAVISQALSLAGLHEPARQDLEYFARWQRDDGLYISRPGQLDGLGQALWGLGEHVRLSGDAAFAAAQLPAVERAVGWLRAARAADPLGLVPPSDPRDNELVAGHLAGDDFWAVAGLDAAADLAAVAGRPDLAQAWRADRDDLQATVVALVRKRGGGAIPPALDVAGGNDWGNLWAAWPYPVFAPRDAQVSATLRRVRRGFAEGIATYGPSLHGYLGFRVFQTELARGEQARAVAGLYASLAHFTATDGCFELGTRPYGRRLIADNLAPHGWCSAELVALVRNMLVRERGAGLQLLGALSPAWLGGNRRLALTDAPTRRGLVDVALRSTRTRATLRWNGPEGVPMWWTVPAMARDVTIGGEPVRGRLVRLPAASGTLEIRWRLRPGRASLARTKQRLARAYEKRGQSPPYVP